MHTRVLDRLLIAACDPHPPERSQGQLAVDTLEALLELAHKNGVLGTVLQSMHKWNAIPRCEDVSQGVTANAIFRRYSDLHFQNMGMVLGLKQIGRQVLNELVGRQIPCCVLKGEDFANRLYPNASLRPFRDVDLLVPEQAFAEADMVIQSLGFEPERPNRKYSSEEYGQVSYFHRSEEGWSLELHWNVINSPAQRRYCSLTWDNFEFISEKGPSGESLLSANSLMVLASVHACLTHRFDSLQQLCDLRQICRTSAGGIDPFVLRDSCYRLRCVTSVQWSLEMLVQVLNCQRARQLITVCGMGSKSIRRMGMLGRPTVLRPSSRVSRFRSSLARLCLAAAS